MSGCTHTLCDDPKGLCCTREEGHPLGHTYSSTSGVAHCEKEEA